MPTLHVITEDTKKIIYGLFVLLGVFIVILIGLRVNTLIRAKYFPTPLPPPTTTFGKLPKISFPNSATTKTFTYTLDTLSGLFPEFPDRLNVYKTTNEPPNLLALTRAIEKAQSIGFGGEPTAVSESVYEWSQPSTPFKKLILNINSYNFSYTSQFLSDQTLVSMYFNSPVSSAEDKAQIFFSHIFFPQDIDSQKTKTTLYQVENNTLVPAITQATTQFVRLDYFQNDIDGLTYYYPHPPYSLIHATVSKDLEVVNASLTHGNIDLNTNATYPIKTAKTAFEDLQKGKAYIAGYDGSQTKIPIKTVRLGYYMGEEKQDYLIPIFVFEGDDNFTAYLPAITSEWITQ